MNRRKIMGKRKFRRKYSGIKNLADGFITRDFSSVEDAPNAFDIIKNIVYKAGKNAAAEAKAAGLPHTFARNNQVIRMNQNGEEEIIETSESSPLKSASYFIRYKPSTILHARKK